jgi:molybdopterin synthase sulfur carrier subunit
MENKTTEVLVFGIVAEIVKADKLQLPFVQTTADIVRYVRNTYPALSQINFAVSVDRTIVSNSIALPPGSEIALLPPFSGG